MTGWVEAAVRGWVRGGTKGINPLLLAGLGALAVYAIAFASPYSLRVLALAGVFAILVLGYQFIFGHAGALSLAQGALFGLGAYVTGILGSQWGWPFHLTFPLSLILPVVTAAVVAAPVLRLETHYFALATLGISQIALIIGVNWISVTGGSNGLAGVPGIVIFGFAVPRGIPLLLFIWGAVAVFGLASWQIMRGMYGRAFQVMRANDAVASAIGLSTARLRFTAFLLSALYAGAAGAFYVHVIRVVSPDTLEFSVMVTCMAMTVVGGRYRVSGAIFGALALVHLPEWFRFLDKYNLIAYGAALLIMIVLAPAGIVGLLERVRQQYWPEKLPAAPRPSSLTIPSRAEADGPLLQVGGLSKSFGGVRAVSNVSFDIGAREIVGLIGPNGSGKTTVINLITGFYKPDAGSVRIHGRNITAALPFMLARSGIARTFQNINLIDEMTALDNVAVARAAMLGQTNLRFAFLSGASGMQVAREHAMSLLERLGIGDMAMAPCGGLAHGIKRKVEIARALALEPELLLLDEPAAGLNALEQADLSGRLRTLTEDGLTLLVVEHNMPFLRAIAQRMICFDQGELLTVGTPEEVCRNPRVLEAYLGMDAA